MKSREKNKLSLLHVATSLLILQALSLSVFAAETVATTSETPSNPPVMGVPPSMVLDGTSTTRTSMGGMNIKRKVHPIVSKITEVPEEKRALVESLPLGKTIFTIVEKLMEASQKSGGLLDKVDTFLDEKETLGADGSLDISSMRVKLDMAKMSLDSANVSISILSSSTERWSNEVSTSSFKKIVQTKKVEFRKEAESARTNIKKTNQALREIMLSFVPQQKESAFGESTTTQTNNSSSTVASLISTSTKKVLLLEQ